MNRFLRKCGAAALVIVTLLSHVMPAAADVQYRLQQSLGYQQFTSVSTSLAITFGSSAPSTGVTGIPAGANSMIISVEGAGIRWRDDKTAPTSSIGMPVAAGSTFVYAGNLPQLQIIGQTAGATLDVVYYY